MRLLAMAGLIGLGLMSAAQSARAPYAEPGGKPPSATELAKDEEILRLVYTAVDRGAHVSREAAQKVLAMDRERVVAILAARTTNRDRGHYCVSFAAQFLPDGRLVAAVEARIRASDGSLLNDTLERLKPAPKEFLRALVPVLVEHALDSDYQGSGGPSGQWMTRSALAETTQLLDKATESKTGIKPVSSVEIVKLERPKLEQRKAEIRATWRAWWAENKDNWPPKESEPPSRGDGVTVVKPPEDKKTGEEKAPPKEDSADAATDAPPAKP